MRAAYLMGPDRFEVREAPDTRPEPGQALVRVRGVGICGTDLNIASGAIPVRYPRVVGHEIVGDLVDPGDGDLAAGDHVLVDPGLFCGSCRQCADGRTNICPTGGLLGRDADGGLQELLAVPASRLHRVPEHVDVALAPMVQVLATCVHGQRILPVEAGETVAVLGLGVTGLLHVQLAKLRGARVVGITRSAEKRALAEQLGADLTIAADGDEVAEAARLLGDVDVVIECAGLVSTLVRSIELVRIGGRILAYGVIGKGEQGSLPYYSLYYKELQVAWARSAAAPDFMDALDLVRDGRVALEPLVQGRFGLDDTAAAFAAAGSSGALKVLVEL